ncbi:hypothetical protein [Paenarthrobacter sp. YJN-5]|uniref:hypothetical protein n=1 Tax=Paenarthrobacter sp. YJN-5 TaxID=2735316 RepID=UPI001877CF34|nr:hypothetical protein [Paenarthrobacter sp. YJN-5]QOT16474.1 hypothetical protein HMI59_07560 [Paenarthrobacter sp. YJN-5]
MRKLGGLIIIGLLGLTACSAPSGEATPAATSSESAVASSKIAPLLAVPSASAVPSPTAGLPPEFYDDSARGRYLAGVKNALNAWRDGVIPSDDDLLKGAEVACGLFAEGKSREDIAGLAGSDAIAIENAAAVASYASRDLCTQYSTFAK